MLNQLRMEIRQVVESYCDEPALLEGMLQALSQPGFALHPEARCTAGLLALKIYEAICDKTTTYAFQSSAAVELYMEAAFIFDNVADQETDSTQGMAMAENLAIAIALMTCGGMAACEASQQMERKSQILRSLFQLQRDCLRACSGQFLDARLQKSNIVSTDEALEMTCLKSGSLGRLAATQGAIMATDSSEIIDLFGEFGLNLFTYLQIIDDMRDACPAEGNMRDMEQAKKTLPLVFFYNSISQERTDSGYDIIPFLYDERFRQEIHQEFGTSGANVFCAIVAESFLNRAKGNLAALKDRVRTVEGLEQFVSTLEISPDEVFAAV